MRTFRVLIMDQPKQPIESLASLGLESLCGHIINGPKASPKGGVQHGGYVALRWLPDRSQAFHWLAVGALRAHQGQPRSSPRAREPQRWQASLRRFCTGALEEWAQFSWMPVTVPADQQARSLDHARSSGRAPGKSLQAAASVGSKGGFIARVHSSPRSALERVNTIAARGRSNALSSPGHYQMAGDKNPSCLGFYRRVRPSPLAVDKRPTHALWPAQLGWPNNSPTLGEPRAYAWKRRSGACRVLANGLLIGSAPLASGSVSNRGILAPNALRLALAREARRHAVIRALFLKLGLPSPLLGLPWSAIAVGAWS